MSQPPAASHPSSAHASTAPQGQAGAAPAIQRQFVNFSFYKLDPAFRRLDESTKNAARKEFLSLFLNPEPRTLNPLMCLTYSTAALRPDCDFLLWRISLNSDDF